MPASNPLPDQSDAEATYWRDKADCLRRYMVRCGVDESRWTDADLENAAGEGMYHVGNVFWERAAVLYLERRR